MCDGLGCVGWGCGCGGGRGCVCMCVCVWDFVRLGMAGYGCFLFFSLSCVDLGTWSRELRFESWNGFLGFLGWWVSFAWGS